MYGLPRSTVQCAIAGAAVTARTVKQISSTVGNLITCSKCQRKRKNGAHRDGRAPICFAAWTSTVPGDDFSYVSVIVPVPVPVPISVIVTVSVTDRTLVG